MSFDTGPVRRFISKAATEEPTDVEIIDALNVAVDMICAALNSLERIADALEKLEARNTSRA